ncbi:hypothetical protein MSZK_33390 [Mycobacterium sp. shizuoka-1]|nr:hypothetical protein MSZK_33390 [Mycobacterium sp. shizuoka-1]
MGPFSVSCSPNTRTLSVAHAGAAVTPATPNVTTVAATAAIFAIFTVSPQLFSANIPARLSADFTVTYLTKPAFGRRIATLSRFDRVVVEVRAG